MASSLLLVTGVVAIGAALLVLALAVLPAGPARVPLTRLDPSAARATAMRWRCPPENSCG